MSNIKTTNYGSETISYLAPKVWDLVPNEIKSNSSLDVNAKLKHGLHALVDSASHMWKTWDIFKVRSKTIWTSFIQIIEAGMLTSTDLVSFSLI